MCVVIDFDQAMEDFWQARQGGPFPVQWKEELDRDTAYQICLKLIDRHTEHGCQNRSKQLLS